MAIVLETNYQKRLGLANYSSHAYSLTIRTEVSDLSQVESASAQLYQQLQEAVDREIQNPGFLPGDSAPAALPPFRRESNSRTQQSQSNDWNCSPKQQGLIEKLIQEHKLDYAEVDNLAQERFRNGLTALNKMQASGMIDELIDTYGQSPRSGNRSYSRGAGSGGRR